MGFLGKGFSALGVVGLVGFRVWRLGLRSGDLQACLAGRPLDLGLSLYSSGLRAYRGCVMVQASGFVLCYLAHLMVLRTPCAGFKGATGRAPQERG